MFPSLFVMGVKKVFLSPHGKSRGVPCFKHCGKGVMFGVLGSIELSWLWHAVGIKTLQTLVTGGCLQCGVSLPFPMVSFLTEGSLAPPPAVGLLYLTIVWLCPRVAIAFPKGGVQFSPPKEHFSPETISVNIKNGGEDASEGKLEQFLVPEDNSSMELQQLKWTQR